MLEMVLVGRSLREKGIMSKENKHMANHIFAVFEFLS